MTLRRITTIAIFFAAIVAMEATWFSQSASAQHTGRRRGAILGGLAGAALGVAIGDRGDNETAGALIGGAAGAVAGGIIGNQRDIQRRNFQQRGHAGTFPAPVYQNPGFAPAHPPLHHTQHQPGPIFSSPTPNQPHYVHPHGPVVMDAPVINQPTPFQDPAFQSQAFQNPAPFQNPVPSSASPLGQSVLVGQSMSFDDVLRLSQSGLSDATIIRQIQRRGMQSPLSVSDMIALYNAGVSEAVLQAMQP